MRIGFAHKTGVLLFGLVLVSACDQGGRGRYVNPADLARQGIGANTFNPTSLNSKTNSPFDYGLNRFNMADAKQCYEQCLRDENGDLPESCPQHCLYYNYNYVQDGYYDADLNSTLSFESGFGASNLGSNIRTPGLREELISRYFQGNPGGFPTAYSSILINDVFPNGVLCPDNRDDCSDLRIKNYRNVYGLGALKIAAYKYQVGDPGADDYYYSVQHELEAEKARGQMDFNIDFDALKEQFKGMGRMVLGGFLKAGTGIVSNVAGGVVHSVGSGVGGLASQLNQVRFSGLTFQYNPTMVYSSFNSLRQGAVYGNREGQCKVQFQNDPEAYYRCVQGK